MSKLLRIGTRSSPLALWQAEWVSARIRERYPDIAVWCGLPVPVPGKEAADGGVRAGAQHARRDDDRVVREVNLRQHGRQRAALHADLDCLFGDCCRLLVVRLQARARQGELFACE